MRIPRLGHIDKMSTSLTKTKTDTMTKKRRNRRRLLNQTIYTNTKTDENKKKFNTHLCSKFHAFIMLRIVFWCCCCIIVFSFFQFVYFDMKLILLCVTSKSFGRNSTHYGLHTQWFNSSIQIYLQVANIYSIIFIYIYFFTYTNGSLKHAVIIANRNKIIRWFNGFGMQKIVKFFVFQYIFIVFVISIVSCICYCFPITMHEITFSIPFNRFLPPIIKGVNEMNSRFFFSLLFDDTKKWIPFSKY